jgi:hypothetical protein
MKLKKWKGIILLLGTKEERRRRRTVRCFAKKITGENQANNFLSLLLSAARPDTGSNARRDVLSA